jgi:hypothetical protein
MATEYKAIAQSAPAATTNTDVYTVPAGTQAIISTVWICNGASSAGTIKMWLRVAGATATRAQVIMDTTPVAANDTTTLNGGLTMGATDVLTVYCSNADMSINLSGAENS